VWHGDGHASNAKYKDHSLCSMHGGCHHSGLKPFLQSEKVVTWLQVKKNSIKNFF